MGNLFYKPTQQDIIKLINDNDKDKLTKITFDHRLLKESIDILSTMDSITMYKILYKRAGRKFISELFTGSYERYSEYNIDRLERKIDGALLLNSKIKLIAERYIQRYINLFSYVHVNYFRKISEILDIGVKNRYRLSICGKNLGVTKNDTIKLLEYSAATKDRDDICSFLCILSRKCRKYAIKKIAKDRLNGFSIVFCLGHRYGKNNLGINLPIFCRYFDNKILLIPDSRIRICKIKLLGTIIVHCPVCIYIGMAIRRRLEIKYIDKGLIIRVVLLGISPYLPKNLSRMSLYYI